MSLFQRLFNSRSGGGRFDRKRVEYVPLAIPKSHQSSVTNLKRHQKPNEYLDPLWPDALPTEKVPGPAGLKLLKNFLPFGRYYKKPLSDVLNSAREQYGNIFRFPGMFGKPDMFMIFDPNDFEKVFRTEGIWPKRLVTDSIAYFRKVKHPDAYKETAGVFVDDDEKWARVRSVLNPIMMQPRTVTRYIPILNDVIHDFVESIRKTRDKNTLEVPGNFDQDIQLLILECMGEIALDTRLGLIGSTKKDSNAETIVHNLSKFFQLMYDIEMKPNISKYMQTPTFRKLMKVLENLNKASSDYVNKAQERIKTKPKESSNEDKSILEELLNIDENIAKVNANDMFIAGVDTTTTGLIGILFHIAKNPDKQEILRKEILSILPKNNSSLTRENMNNLPYLRACIKESFRLNPPTSGISRITTQNIVLSGYKIPKNSSLGLFTQPLMIEEVNFPKSKQYIPERWLRGSFDGSDVNCPSARTANPFIFLPFGFGPRMCVGKRFASMQLEVALAKLIRNFRIEFNYPDLTFESRILNIPVGYFGFKFIDLEH